MSSYAIKQDDKNKFVSKRIALYRHLDGRVNLTIIIQGGNHRRYINTFDFKISG